MALSTALKNAFDNVLKGVGNAEELASAMDSATLSIGSASATDIAKVVGITNGTGLASKAVVLDANGMVTMPTAPAVSAAGTTQGTATAIAKLVNDVTTVAANAGVVLPTNANGLSIFIVNNGANALNVYPDTGAAINNLGTNNATILPVGQSAWFTCVAANVWTAEITVPRIVNTALTTAGAGTITGAGLVGGVVTRTGPSSAFTDTTDTAANIIAALHGAAIGQSWYFTYINTTAFLATFANGSGVTVSSLAGGVLTCPQNSWAEFVITYTAASTFTMAVVATGPNVALPPAKFSTINVTTGTLAAGNASGAGITHLTSTNATPGSQAMRTAAQILTDTPGLYVGMSYYLRIYNSGGGTFTLATDASAQFTMTGTMTISTVSMREFIVTINTATTGTVQSLGQTSIAT